MAAGVAGQPVPPSLGDGNAPGGIMLPEIYNQLVAMHGTVMIFPGGRAAGSLMRSHGSDSFAERLTIIPAASPRRFKHGEAYACTSFSRRDFFHRAPSTASRPDLTSSVGSQVCGRAHEAIAGEDQESAAGGDGPATTAQANRSH